MSSTCVTYREQPDVLSVGCWDGTLSQYDLDGKQIGNTTDLGFMPCCVSYMPKGKDAAQYHVCMCCYAEGVVSHGRQINYLCTVYPAQDLLTLLLMCSNILFC